MNPELYIDFSISKNRVLYIAKLLLEANDWIKSVDVQEKLSISPAQFSRDLKKVRNLLAGYDIQIVSKPHYGIHVLGKEYDIRRCLSSVFSQLWKSNGEDSEQQCIRSIILNACESKEFEVSSFTINNLTGYLYATYKRIGYPLSIVLSKSNKEKLKDCMEYELAQKILCQMSENFDINFDEEDRYAIAIQLRAMKIGNETNTISMSLVEKMIEKIREEYGIDLEKNLDFKMMLAVHVTPLIERVKYKINIENPLLAEIKSKFLLEYDISLCCAKVIEKEYKCILSEDEIGNLAIYIKIALSQMETQRKKKVLLICSTGRGTVQLLKLQIETLYRDEIENLDFCDIYQFSKLDLSKYDAVFTTIRLPENAILSSIPVFFVDSLMQISDEKNIELFLKKGLDINNQLKFFRKDMFFGDIDVKDQNECIHEIVQRLNKVCELPDGFEKAIERREALTSTYFENSRVAFPHPDRILTDYSFVSVSVLKKPISWANGKVQVVLLSSFEKKFIKNYQDVFQIISKIITEKKYVDMLVEHPKYETLRQVVWMITGSNEES